MLVDKFIISNHKGQRQYDYLIANASEEQILKALEGLGGRKPFPLNILKALKINIDNHEINKSDKETALNYLKDIKNILNFP